MQIIHIDLPIFYSPTGSLGYFSGAIEVSRMPQVGAPFPWPEHWLVGYEATFQGQGDQVWRISPWQFPPAREHVSMYGIVCGGRQEATSLCAHIERLSGILFSA